MTKRPHTCGQCGEPIHFVSANDMPMQTVEMYGLEALKKIGEMCFGFFPMNYESNDFKIHHCTLKMYFEWQQQS
jgi:hypothetical protein